MLSEAQNSIASDASVTAVLTCVIEYINTFCITGITAYTKNYNDENECDMLLQKILQCSLQVDADARLSDHNVFDYEELKDRIKVCLEGYNPHAIATVVKLALRGLREPLIPDIARQADTITDDETNFVNNIETIDRLLSKLSDERKRLLKLILNHLHEMYKEGRCTEEGERLICLAENFGRFLLRTTDNHESKNGDGARKLIWETMMLIKHASLWTFGLTENCFAKMEPRVVISEDITKRLGQSDEEIDADQTDEVVSFQESNTDTYDPNTKRSNGSRRSVSRKKYAEPSPANEILVEEFDSTIDESVKIVLTTKSQPEIKDQTSSALSTTARKLFPEIPDHVVHIQTQRKLSDNKTKPLLEMVLRRNAEKSFSKRASASLTAKKIMVQTHGSINSTKSMLDMSPDTLQSPRPSLLQSGTIDTRREYSLPDGPPRAQGYISASNSGPSPLSVKAERISDDDSASLKIANTVYIDKDCQTDTCLRMSLIVRKLKTMYQILNTKLDCWESLHEQKSKNIICKLFSSMHQLVKEAILCSGETSTDTAAIPTDYDCTIPLNDTSWTEFLSAKAKCQTRVLEAEINELRDNLRRIRKQNETDAENIDIEMIALRSTKAHLEKVNAELVSASRRSRQQLACYAADIVHLKRENFQLVEELKDCKRKLRKCENDLDECQRKLSKAEIVAGSTQLRLEELRQQQTDGADQTDSDTKFVEDDIESAANKVRSRDRLDAFSALATSTLSRCEQDRNDLELAIQKEIGTTKYLLQRANAQTPCTILPKDESEITSLRQNLMRSEQKLEDAIRESQAKLDDLLGQSVPKSLPGLQSEFEERQGAAYELMFASMIDNKDSNESSEKGKVTPASVDYECIPALKDSMDPIDDMSESSFLYRQWTNTRKKQETSRPSLESRFVNYTRHKSSSSEEPIKSMETFQKLLDSMKR